LKSQNFIKKLNPIALGVDVFYPEEIKDNQHIPDIAITSFKVLNKEIELDTNILEKKEIYLSYKDNEFSFEFVALDFSFSDKNLYAYKLEGYDKEYIYCDNRRFVSYTNLDPGTYTFIVKGSNNDGVWNKKGAEIKIIISAPFWQKPWFFVLLGLIVIGFIFGILKYRDITRDKKHLETQVQKRTEKIIQQKEEIVAQMEQIENQRNKLEQSYKNIKLLSEIGRQITASLSFEKITEIVHQNVNNLMNADIFAIGMYNSDKERLEFLGSKMNGETVPKFFIGINEKDKLAIWCLKNKQEILINDFQNEYLNYVTTLTPAVLGESSSIIYYPILSKNECSGVITVQNYKKNVFTNYHLNIIRNLAVYTGIAFDNSSAYNQIEHQKKGITDSIFYASRIQGAILTPRIFLDALFKDYFILNKPRDIVSGDFYWVKNVKIQNETLIVIAAADCTGHGVPGAFMSMMGISLLNEIIANLENIQQIGADIILNELRKSVIRSLHQTGKIGEPQDGMDIALAIINYSKMQMECSGANNPVYIIRKNTDIDTIKEQEYILLESEADRMPIGYFGGKEKDFAKNIFPIYSDDAIYVYSDGYIDQFGGPVGKKVLSKNFKRLLLSFQNETMEMQKLYLENNIIEWMAHTNKQGITYPQLDDILVFGVKI